MTTKSLILTILCLTTVTACASPLDSVLSQRHAARLQQLENTATVSGGACDDVGQFIPTQNKVGLSVTFEASAAPLRATIER